MAETPFQIQILDRSDYRAQFLISVPHESSCLASGTIRIQSRILSVTSNTFLYARLGHILNWWDVWSPVDDLAPPPYNDATKYGRISSWGYAEVVESNHNKVPVGTVVFGYLPIGTYPETLKVDIDNETGHLIEVSERRRRLMNMYNRYLCLPAKTDLSDKRSLGMDSVMRVLFETAYLLNRYAFAWEGKPSHPMGLPAPGGWTEADGDLTDAVVILLGASGKTGSAFAHQLRNGRPVESQPKKIIAVGSEQSRNFSRNTCLFDDVVTYADYNNSDVIRSLGVGRNVKVLLANFGARGDADLNWFNALQPISSRVIGLMIGSDPTSYTRSNLAALAEDPESGVVRGNASTLRDFAIAKKGSFKYFEGLEESWANFKEGDSVPGFELQWGKGLEALRDGWDALCTGKTQPTAGLVFEI